MTPDKGHKIQNPQNVDTNTFFLNPPLLFWIDSVWNILNKRMTYSINELINDKGVFKTAPTSHSLLNTLHTTLHTAHTPHTPHHYIPYYTFHITTHFTKQLTLHTPHQYTPHYTLNTPHQYTPHYTLHTPYQYTPHYTLHTPHQYTLNSTTEESQELEPNHSWRCYPLVAGL